MPDGKFSGFPAEVEFTSLPDVFFTHVVPQIQDLAELKVTMYIFYLLSHKQGYPPFVTYGELLSQKALMTGIDEEVLRYALHLAVNRGAILHLNLKIDGKREDAYFANMESDREAIAKIERGELSVRAQPSSREGIGRAVQLPNIFSLYEQNIGVITPMIVEELKEASRLYPAQWIDEAFREAVLMNKRIWKYIARILERWASEGKDSGEHRQSTKKVDPDKYFRGKYGHLVKR
ncbi:MAG: DnaD domain protein [Dehalococcoidia bacterium]|nr:DnaD domain protein [Dehalococcoidia bacterium]